MCVFSAPSVPAPAVTVAAPAPTIQNYTDSDPTKAAQQNERKRVAAAAGYSSTMTNGGLGLTGEAPTTGKSLLGQ